MPSCVKGEAPSSAVPQVCFDVYRLDLPNEQLWRGLQALPLTAKALRVLGLPVAGIAFVVCRGTTQGLSRRNFDHYWWDNHVRPFSSQCAARSIDTLHKLHNQWC
jgi:hypothetical protein